MPPPPRSTPIAVPRCPRCHAARTVPIIYGLPGPELADEERRGRLVLGGCIVGNARWHCKDCEHNWP